MPPKADPKVKADAKGKAKAKAKARAGYTTPPVPTPYNGVPDDFIAQMLTVQDMLQNVAMSSSATLSDVQPVLQKQIDKMNELNNTIKSEAKTRQSLKDKVIKDAEAKVAKVAKAKAKKAYSRRTITLTVNFKGEVMTVSVSAFISIGSLRRVIISQWNASHPDDTIAVAKSRQMALNLDGEALKKHPRSKLYTSGFNTNSVVDAVIGDTDVEGEEEEQDDETFHEEGEEGQSDDDDDELDEP